MDCGRRIYTRRQWVNFYSEWNVEKKRKLSKNCKSESVGFSANGKGEISEFAVVIVEEEKAGVSVEKEKRERNDDNFSFVDELNKNKRKRSNGGTKKNDSNPHLDSTRKGKGKGKIVSGGGNVSSEDEDKDEPCASLLNEKDSYFDDEYTELLDGLKKDKKRGRNAGCEKNDNDGDYTELLVESCDPRLGSTGKVETVSGDDNVSSKDEDEDMDETFVVGKEEIALESILSEKTDNPVENSSENEDKKDNLSTENDEVSYPENNELRDGSRGSPLNEKPSYYDDEYIEFLEEHLGFPPASSRETSKNGEEDKTDDPVENSNKNEDEMDNLSTDNGEVSYPEQNELRDGSRGSPLNEKPSYYDDEYNEFLEEHLGFPPASSRETSKNGEEDKTDDPVENSNKNEDEKDNLSTDNGEVSYPEHNEFRDGSRGSPLNEKSSYYDDEYNEFLEEHLGFSPASSRETSKNGEEDKKRGDANEESDNNDCIESLGESSTLSSDSAENLEKWAEKKKKRKEKMEKADDNVGPKVEGRAYHLRSSSMKENNLKNVKTPPPVSEEDSGSDSSSDEANENDNSTRNHVRKDTKTVDPPSKTRKSKHGLRGLNFKKILLNSISENMDVTKNKLQFCKENIPGQLPLKFRLEDKDSAPPEKSEWEKEIDGLFADLQTGRMEQRDSLTTQHLGDENVRSAEKCDDSAVCCLKGKHFLILDEQIGLMCKYCSFVHLERKYILPSFANRTGRRRGIRFFDESHCLLNDDSLPLDGNAGNHCTPIHGGTTTWDVLPPRTKQTMYPHQCEGFEFLWRNIAGDIHIENLKKLQAEGDCGKGCIMSHAPGTGKTRLTIVFLQSFMKLFPNCHPVIIAPRSMLLTWEDELKKWGVDIPFHNLNNPMLSGRENSIAHSFPNELRNKDSKRMLKVYSWAKGPGILGITYRLFEQMVSVNEDKEHNKLRNILLRVPGLVVLDEGHTPRNDDSLIWKALSRLETPRRIILSGTPFQNNFDELYNTMCLVCPQLSDFTSGSRPRYFRKRKAAKKRWDRLTSSIGKNKNDEIKELKRIIAPLVHVHNGSVLLERLPGLRTTLIHLKPTNLQQKLLGVMPKKNLLEEDHIMTRISIHPSLVKDLPGFSEYRSEVEDLELDPDAGAKTEFLFALIRLSESHGEKVIVFSQYIPPMDLIKKQLKSVFGWVEGREVLLMDGENDVHHRQAYINSLNDPTSEVKVLLASTRACSEGINLVGASRVVLLDVVWNPSVKRQAISRAYRLGQKKIVHVYHLISSTMEARKYACQAKKDIISELVFSTLDGLPSKTDLPVSEDKILEAMVQHPKHSRIFDRLVYGPKETDLIDTFDFME